MHLDNAEMNWLKSPVLVFSGRYPDIFGSSFAANCHFYLSPFHFWLTLQSVHMLCQPISTHVHDPEALSHCGHGHDLISVAQLSVVNIADIRSAFVVTLVSEHFHSSKEARQR